MKPFLCEIFSLNEAQRIKQKCERNILVVSLVMALHSLIMVNCICVITWMGNITIRGT